MQVEHLFSYSLYHELWNQNLINEEGFIIADTKDLKRYKTFLEEEPLRRGAETHKNRKRILDETQELLKCESLTASQEEDLHALLQSLQLDVGEDGYFILRPDVQAPKKKYPGVREPSLSLWELKIDEAVRAKKVQRRDLRTLDKWLCLIADSKAKARKPSSCETEDWKELEKKCRKRTRDRLNEMKMKRINKINSFHADNDYAWKKMCGMKVFPKEVSKEKSLETMYPLRQATPHIMAPPKSAIDRGFGFPKKEKGERDDTSKHASFKQKSSETTENMDATLDAASSLPKVRGKEKAFAFGDHVDPSLEERTARKREKIRKRLKLFQRMIARKMVDQEEMKDKEQQKLGKTYSLVDKSKIGSRESETIFKKDLRKVEERKTRDAISVREKRKISDDEKGVLHEEEILRKSEEFETLIKSENGECRQDIVEDKMTSKLKLSDDSTENSVISETVSDILNLVELNYGELKEPKIEGLRKLRQSLPVISSKLTLEVAELLKDMFCSIEINIGEEGKTANLLLSDTTKVSLPRTYEEGRDYIKRSTRETIEDNLEIIETFDGLLNSMESEEPTGFHLEDLQQEDAAGREEINESIRETIESNLDVIGTSDYLLNSIASEEPIEGHLKDSDQLTDAEGRDEVNEPVRETIFKKDLRKVEERKTRDAISVREKRKISDDEKGVLHEEEILRKSEEFETLIKSENGECRQDIVEDKMTSKLKLSDDSRENSIISETISGILNLVELNYGELKEPKIEGLRKLRQSLPVVSSKLTLEVAELLKDMFCSVEINIEEESKTANLLLSDTTKVSLPRTYEEGRKGSTRETIEDNLEVIETFYGLLNSMESEEPTGFHLENLQQDDAAGREEINVSIRETVEANLDVIGTSDYLLNSIESEEPTEGHLKDFDQLNDAEGRDEVNEPVREIIKNNLDMIKTFDDLLNSIASEEPPKCPFEDVDQLTGAEVIDEVNESVRETIEENLDVIEIGDDVLNSIASEEPTESYLDGPDKWESTDRNISIHKKNIENLEKDLIKDITDKLIEADLYSLHLESGEDLIPLDEEHLTEKRMEQVTDLEALEKSADVEFIRACRMAAESKSFENELPAEELLPKFCTLDEILRKCVSPIKYTNIQEESLEDLESLSLKRTDIEETGLEIHEEKYSSEVFALDISESTSRKLLTPKSIKQESVQLIEARQSLALSENLETFPYIECKPNICTIDEISEQCGSPSKLENIAEMPFRDVHSVIEEVSLDLLGRETEGCTAKIPIEEILEATSQLIMKESDKSSDIVKAISSSMDVKHSGVESEFEEICLGISTFSCLQKQEDDKRKSVEQNLLVLDPRKQEVPISVSEIPRVKTDDRMFDTYDIRKYSDDDSQYDSEVKIQDVEDSNLFRRSAKAEPSRFQLQRGSTDSFRQKSMEKFKEKRLSSSRAKEHPRKLSLKERDTSEVIPHFHECFHTIGEKLKNAERKLSMLASKTGSSGRVFNGKQQKSRRSTILPSRSKTQLSEERRKTRSSISEKDQDQKPITSVSREMKPQQEHYFQKDGAKDLRDKKIQAHPSTSETLLPRRPSEQKDGSEPKSDETTQRGGALKHPWPAFIKVDTQNLAGISAAILEKTRAFKSNKGLILNKSLFSSLDECKYIKKDK